MLYLHLYGLYSMVHFITSLVYGLSLFGLGLAGIAHDVTREDIEDLVRELLT